MSGTKLFLDTNIVLYLLNGDKTLAETIDEKQIFISFISEIELLSYRGINLKEKNAIKKFIEECSIIDVNHRIKELSTQFRLKYNLKLPDALVAASAFYLGIPLLTADKDFSKLDELSLILYSQV
jgi:predicted nucleic acid-binding protein